MTFTAEGRMVVQGPGGIAVQLPVTADTKETPAEARLLRRAGVTDPPDRGIFKVEGDTLTICAGKERPAKFDFAGDGHRPVDPQTDGEEVKTDW